MSIVFDRAVGYYDQTRTLPLPIQNAALDTLTRETGITSAARVLEIGVGTGRIALPLTERIGRVYGVDLSLPMMEVLRRKTHADRVRLAQADAVALPFPTSTFDAAYGVHVLHLVSGWQNAVAEVMRVLQPGGSFVVSFHRRYADSPNVLLRKQMRAYARELGVDATRPGAPSEDVILEELQKWDSGARVVKVMSWSETDTPRAIIEELDRQIYSETWLIPRGVMDQIMPRLAEWAAAHFGSLDAQVVSPYDFQWLIVRKPAA